MASIAAAAPMAPRARAACDGRAWPGVSVSAHFRQRKKAVVISTSQKLQNVGTAHKTFGKLADFQAEYEGSILFTRSNFCLGGCFDAQCHATA
jgi:hypothetical protein